MALRLEKRIARCSCKIVSRSRNFLNHPHISSSLLAFTLISVSSSPTFPRRPNRPMPNSLAISIPSPPLPCLTLPPTIYLGWRPSNLPQPLLPQPSQRPPPNPSTCSLHIWPLPSRWPDYCGSPHPPSSPTPSPPGLSFSLSLYTYLFLIWILRHWLRARGRKKKQIYFIFISGEIKSNKRRYFYSVFLFLGFFWFPLSLEFSSRWLVFSLFNSVLGD